VLPDRSMTSRVSSVMRRRGVPEVLFERVEAAGL
jgi:hypothetical protein